MGSAITNFNCCNRSSTNKEQTNIDITKIKSPILSETKISISPRRIDSSQLNFHSKLIPPLPNLNYTVNTISATIFNSRNNSSVFNVSFKSFNDLIKSKIRSTIEVINEKYTKDQISLIKKILFNQKILFYSMDDITINKIFEESVLYRIKSNVVFFQYSFEDIEEEDDKIYIVLKGDIIVTLNKEKQLLYGKSTLINTKLLKTSHASIELKTAEKHIYLFSLSIDKYNSIIKESEEKQLEKKFNVIKGIYLFSNLDKKIQTQIVNELIIIKSDSKRLLIAENSQSESIFILITGAFIAAKNDTIISTITTQFSIIGDVTLLTGNDSFYSYYVKEKSVFYEIKYQTLKDAYNNNINYVNKIILAIFNNAIKNCSFLSKYFSAFNMESLYKLFELTYYINGTVINKRQNKLIILLSGSLFLNQKTKIQIGNKGQVFKDILLNNSAAILTDECVVLETQWSEVLKIIKSYTVKKFNLFQITSMIRKCMSIYKGIKTLSEYRLLKLAESVKPIKFKQDELIFNNGPTYHQMFIVLSGEVSEIANEMEIRVVTEGDFFGDIVSTADQDSIVKSYITKSTTECLVIDKKDYDTIMESDFMKKFNKMISQSNTVNVEKKKLRLDRLYYVKDIGQGSYGKVYLVTDLKFFYAMKTTEIQAMDLNDERAQYYLNEKSIMLNINFPFIVKLYQTFKTREYIFFLQEFINGITLRNYLEEHNSSSDLRNLSKVQFYGSIITMILDYLETKRIIHRDLKPDNLIIDSDGYLKAIDFGIAKDITGADFTSSLIGTCHYMAPEISLGKSYSFAVDYWSMGVILYEIFYGKVPFGFGYTDPVKIYKEIQENNPLLASDEKNEKINDLLRGLLNKNPKKRIHSYAKIKSHSFYEGFDFESIMKKESKAPFIPPSDPIIKEAEKEKKCLQVDNSKKYIPFEQFMKNRVFCSSEELDNVLKKKETEDLFDDF